jgi:tetratricopeptide (TPR) repeat protein
MMHLNENRPEQALEYLRKLEILVPQHSQVHYNLALTYFRLGQTAEGQQAMAKFEKLKLKEREEWLKHNRAYQIRLQAADALAKKDAGESIRLYEQIVKDGVAEPEDLRALADAYSIAGNRNEALHWYEETLKVAPYNREVIAGAARTAKALGKTQTAEMHEARLKLLDQPCD